MHPVLYILTFSVCWLTGSLYLAMSPPRSHHLGQWCYCCHTNFPAVLRDFPGLSQRKEKWTLGDRRVCVSDTIGLHLEESEDKVSTAKKWNTAGEICYSWCVEHRSYFQSKGTFSHSKLHWGGTWLFLTIWHIWAKTWESNQTVQENPGKKLSAGLVDWLEFRWCGDHHWMLWIPS